MEYCREYAPLISAAVDGEVSPEERRDLMEHLAQCPACRGAYEEMLAMHMAFRELDTEVPGDLAGDVMAKVRSQQKRPRRRYWMQLSVAAACCALVFLGYRTLGLGTADNSAPMVTDATVQSDSTAGGDERSVDPSTARIETAQTTDETEEADASADEQIMESVLTYFRTAPKITAYTGVDSRPASDEEQPPASDALTAPADNSAAETDAVEMAAISSSHRALAEWMTANTDAQAYAQDDATAWLITAAECRTLEAFLTEEAIPYSVDSVQLTGELQAGSDAMVCVVYLEADSQAAGAP